MAYEAGGAFHGTVTDLETELSLAYTHEDQQADCQILLAGHVIGRGDYNTRPISHGLRLARKTPDQKELGSHLNSLGNWHLRMSTPSNVDTLRCSLVYQSAGSFKAVGNIAMHCEKLDLRGCKAIWAVNLIQGTTNYHSAVSCIIPRAQIIDGVWFRVWLPYEARRPDLSYCNLTRPPVVSTMR